jgi:hypothetical protein
MSTEPGNYLATVKADFLELVQALEQEVGTAESADAREAIFAEWTKEAWPFLEKSLKTSYKNGRSATAVRAEDGTTKSPNRFRGWRDRKKTEPTES